jgi:fructose-bisphosphate aldolase/2-amino-3,7-dideoxy-D-threo-hept-6-ulosonate synthase
MARIFREDKKTLIVPMESLAGWNGKDIGDWGKVARQVIKGGADVIMTTYGIAKQYYKELIGKDISLILTVQLEALYYVDEALRMGADAVKYHYFGPYKKAPRLQITQLANKCEKLGMPFLLETVPYSETLNAENKREQLLDASSIRKAVRRGVTYGSDFIKTSYTGDPESFKQVVKDCPVPVVILGGSKISNKQLLERVKGAIEAGAAGIACGRNIYNNEKPESVTRALVRIIHENASVEEAMEELEG